MAPFDITYHDLVLGQSSTTPTLEEHLLRIIVWQAVGAASVCWQDLSKAGVFDSTEALKVAESLINELKAWRLVNV